MFQLIKNSCFLIFPWEQIGSERKNVDRSQAFDRCFGLHNIVKDA